MIDLETVTTEELAAEIKRRSDAYLLVIHYSQTKTCADENETLVCFHGGVPMAIGLAEWAKNYMVRHHISERPREIQ